MSHRRCWKIKHCTATAYSIQCTHMLECWVRARTFHCHCQVSDCEVIWRRLMLVAMIALEYEYIPYRHRHTHTNRHLLSFYCLLFIFPFFAFCAHHRIHASYTTIYKIHSARRQLDNYLCTLDTITGETESRLECLREKVKKWRREIERARTIICNNKSHAHTCLWMLKTIEWRIKREEQQKQQKRNNNNGSSRKGISLRRLYYSSSHLFFSPLNSLLLCLFIYIVRNVFCVQTKEPKTHE